MREIIKVERGRTYHLYNRGNNGENLFLEERNYPYFLKRWVELVAPVAETFAYCLLGNHFHLLLRIKKEEIRELHPITEKEKILDPGNQLAKFFNSYAQSINTGYGRTGSLFEHPFKRIEVDNDTYFTRLIAYIHFNPQNHGFVNDFRDWPHSSYRIHLEQENTFVVRNEVIGWFGSQDKYVDFHNSYRDFKEINSFLNEAD